MRETGYAFFVHHPRHINDLKILHAIDQEKPYQIVKSICLPIIDYDNFITDMTVDRDFLEKYASLWENAEIKKCLLVFCRSREKGILVITEDDRWVGWAAIPKSYK